SRSNNISNQPNVIVISDTDDEPFINDHYRNILIRILLKESTSNVVVW
ncbi:25124_t:CDS:1, partial [Gigaspora margarita]